MSCLYNMSIADVSGLTLTIEDGGDRMTIHRTSIAQCKNCRIQTYHTFSSADVDIEEDGTTLVVVRRVCDLCDSTKVSKISLLWPSEEVTK